METSVENKHKMITNNGGFEGIESTTIIRSQCVMKEGNKKAIESCESILRVLAIILTLSSAVIIGVDNQTKVVSIQLVETLPPISLPVSAKWHYLSALLYFLAANAIACVYATISLVYALATRGKKTNSPGFLITALDVVTTALLFSSNGAATAIGVMGFEGNSHVQWRKVCDVFGKFCHQGAYALVASLLGAIVFLSLVILATKRLHN